MPLTTQDLIKIENLFVRTIDPRFEAIESKLENVIKIQNYHSNLLIHIMDRLDRSQLPVIETRLKDHETRIASLEAQNKEQD